MTGNISTCLVVITGFFIGGMSLDFNNDSIATNNSQSNEDIVTVAENCSINYTFHDTQIETCDIIDVHSCRIQKESDVCVKCKSLEMCQGCSCLLGVTIDLSDKNITYLKTDVFTCVWNITTLNLADNMIANVPENFFINFKSLQKLSLAGNLLREIGDVAFKVDASLQELDLSTNIIRNVQTDSFSSLGGLICLDLSHNILETVKLDTFAGLDNLQFLNLRGNKLTDRVFPFLEPLHHLRLIDLSENKISNVERNAFSCPLINHVLLSKMPTLKYISSKAFKNGSEIEVIDLAENSNLVYIDNDCISPANLPYLKLLNISGTKIRMLPELENATTVVFNDGIVDNETCFPMTFINADSHLNEMAYKKEFGGVGSSNDENTSKYSGKSSPCGPRIVSDTKSKITAFIGYVVKLHCFAVGNPWPMVSWIRSENDEFSDQNSVLSKGPIFIFKVKSLNQSGKYACVSSNLNHTVLKVYNLVVKHETVALKVLASNAYAVVVRWNASVVINHHVILYRAFETTINYKKQTLNNRWKIFKIGSLQPDTPYEVCIASRSDINDKTCVRTMTSPEVEQPLPDGGIHHNGLSILALTIAALVFCIFLLSVFYRCFKKINSIIKRDVFVVGTETCGVNDEFSETTFLYENQCTDLLIDTDTTERTDC